MTPDLDRTAIARDRDYAVPKSTNMATVTTYRCDVCQKLKGQSNHWFRGLIIDGGKRFWLHVWDAPMVISPSQGIPEGDEVHLCGLGCAMKFMEQSLGGKR